MWRSRRFRAFAIVSFVSVATTVLTLPFWLPSVLTAYRDDLTFRVRGAGPKLFLTIDDSPSAITGEILAVLATHEVTATFFIIGGRVQDPVQLDAIRAAGHALGHHMKTTRTCSKLSPGEFRAEFDEVDQLLAAHGGVRLFRPPSDFGTREQIAYVSSRGYSTVVGTIFPLDHWIESPEAIRRLAEWLVVDGGIIILHDGPDRGSRTATVLDKLIPELKRKGFTFGNLPTALTTRPAATAR